MLGEFSKATDLPPVFGRKCIDDLLFRRTLKEVQELLPQGRQ